MASLILLQAKSVAWARFNNLMSAHERTETAIKALEKLSKAPAHELTLKFPNLAWVSVPALTAAFDAAEAARDSLRQLPATTSRLPELLARVDDLLTALQSPMTSTHAQIHVSELVVRAHALLIALHAPVATARREWTVCDLHCSISDLESRMETDDFTAEDLAVSRQALRALEPQPEDPPSSTHPRAARAA